MLNKNEIVKKIRINFIFLDNKTYEEIFLTKSCFYIYENVFFHNLKKYRIKVCEDVCKELKYKYVGKTYSDYFTFFYLKGFIIKFD